MSLARIDTITDFVGAAAYTSAEFVSTNSAHFYTWLKINPSVGTLFVISNVALIAGMSNLIRVLNNDMEAEGTDPFERVIQNRFFEVITGFVSFGINYTINCLLTEQYRLGMMSIGAFAVTSVLATLLFKRSHKIQRPTTPPPIHTPAFEYAETPIDETPEQGTVEETQRLAEDESRRLEAQRQMDEVLIREHNDLVEAYENGLLTPVPT